MGCSFLPVSQESDQTLFQLIGWFVFGSLLVVKGAIINHYASTSKEFGRALAGDHFQPETSTATFPVLEVESVSVVEENN